jgi:hypothetical protein
MRVAPKDNDAGFSICQNQAFEIQITDTLLTKKNFKNPESLP